MSKISRAQYLPFHRICHRAHQTIHIAAWGQKRRWESSQETYDNGPELDGEGVQSSISVGLGISYIIVGYISLEVLGNNTPFFYRINNWFHHLIRPYCDLPIGLRSTTEISTWPIHLPATRTHVGWLPRSSLAMCELWAEAITTRCLLLTPFAAIHSAHDAFLDWERLGP